MKNKIKTFEEFYKCIKNNIDLEFWDWDKCKTSTISIKDNLLYYFNNFTFIKKEKNKLFEKHNPCDECSVNITGEQCEDCELDYLRNEKIKINELLRYIKTVYKKDIIKIMEETI